MSLEKFTSPSSAFDALQVWKSNLLFMKDEARFFMDLLDKHFDALIEQVRVDSTHQLVEELNDWAVKDLDQHLQLCYEVEVALSSGEKEIPPSTKALLQELASNMRELEARFRELKKGIFELVEELMKSEGE